MYLDRQRYTVFWPYTICRPNTNTKINRTSTHTRSVFFFLHVAIRNSLRSNKNEHVRSDPPTHHDIVKQYRKGLAAVVDRCVNISYNRYHSVAKSFICCCSGRDSCMLTSRCMLHSLRSASYPALMSLRAPAPGRRHASRVLRRSFQTVQSNAPGLQLHPPP